MPLRTHRRCAALALWLVPLMTPGAQAVAAEYITDEQPPPASVEDERSPMEDVFPPDVPEWRVLPRLRKRLETAAPFWRDTRLGLFPRVYYFDRQRENAQDSEALAYGGRLACS